MPSTVISRISYEPETLLLRITYNSGACYCYKEVPEIVYKELRASLVKGRYLQHFIKGKYAYEKC